MMSGVAIVMINDDVCNMMIYDVRGSNCNDKCCRLIWIPLMLAT